MEVAEHDIRAPPTDKLDDAGVDPATKKGHGATCTTRASGDIVGIETKRGSQDSCGGTNRLGDQWGRNSAICSGCGASDGAQGGIGRSFWHSVSNGNKSENRNILSSAFYDMCQRPDAATITHPMANKEVLDIARSVKFASVASPLINNISLEMTTSNIKYYVGFVFEYYYVLYLNTTLSLNQ
jgi:hypothetical protein